MAPMVQAPYLPLAATMAISLHGILRPAVLHPPRKGSQFFVRHRFNRAAACTETVIKEC